MDGHAPILSLKDQCFGEIFGLLNLRDLSVISETCKRLNEAVGKYFEQNYKSKGVAIEFQNGQVFERLDGADTTFGRYAYEVQVFDEDISVFKYIAEKVNENVKAIDFVMLSTTHAECIKNILKNVETLRMIYCLVDGQNYDNILKYCLNLKCLSISDSQDSRVQWPKKNYPNLESLTVLDNSEGPFDSLKSFLKINPQIKRFTTSIYRAQLFEMIEQATLKLDEFAFEIHDFDKTSAEATRIRLGILYKKGYYKQVKISYYKGNELVDFIDTVRRIPGLTAVDFVHCIYHGNLRNEMTNVAKALATLNNLVELGFQQCEISLAQADVISRALVNLERLHLQRNSIETSVPFARRLPKLKLIKIGVDSSITDIDVSDLQNYRQKLNNAQKLKIYLPEDAYLDIKWTVGKVNFPLIELKMDTILYDDCTSLH